MSDFIKNLSILKFYDLSALIALCLLVLFHWNTITRKNRNYDRNFLSLFYYILFWIVTLLFRCIK